MQSEPLAEPEVERLEDMKIVGLGESHPTLAMWLFSSPIIAILLIGFVPFVLIGLTLLKSPHLMILGIGAIYLFFVGAVLAPFLVYRSK